MIDIEKIKPEIIERLKPLNPDKIILFGSYAYGTPTEDSDIDLFLIKDISKEEVHHYQVEAGLKLFDLIKKYKIGFDIFVDSRKRIEERVEQLKDQFYDEIMSQGKVVYE